MVLELLDDPGRRKRMGEIGLQRSIEVVGLDRSRKALLEGYSRLVEMAPTAEPLSEVSPAREEKTSGVTS
jgi:hypothetical protein